MRAPELRLRAPTPGLLGLPWDRPLDEWNVPDVPLRDIAVGPSRHLVKFVDADGQLWAVKDMPPRIAAKEYERPADGSRRWGCPRCVRPAWCCSPSSTTAILVTRYLEGSWQYRRLFMRLPPDQTEAPGAAAGRDGRPAGRTAPRTASSGVTARWPTRCSPRRPAPAGLAGRRRDLRGPSVAEPGPAPARPRDPGGERGGGPRRPRRAARRGRRSCTIR